MKRQFTDLIGVCVTLITLLLCQAETQAQYCASSYTNLSDDWLDGVLFASIDNQNTGSTSYSDFTGQVGNVEQGVSYGFIGTIGNLGTWNQFISVFIDFNQDEVFDNVTERFDLGNCAFDGCTIIGDILIPEGATPGVTSMRVIENWDGFVADPCYSGTYGETEDYSLLIGGDCTPPNFTYTITNDCELFTYDVTATLNDFGSDLDGLNESITIYLNRSDIGDAGFVTFGDDQVGQTVDVIPDVPFGVTVTASIEGADPVCYTSRTWTEDGLCPPMNNACETAIELVCGETIDGSTINGFGAPAGIDFCNGLLSPSAPAVWHKFTADSYSFLTLSITPDNFDAQHFVYTGGCGNLQCIDGSDDAPISWTAAAGQTFYIIVTGWGTSAGNFALNLECTTFPACDYPTLNTTMVDESGDEIIDCLPFGDTYRVEVSLADGYEDAYLVFVGDSSKVMVPPETHVFGTFDAGSNTNVIVSSFELPEFCNLYGLIESELCPAQNDLCENDFEVVCGGLYEGTTLGATSDPAQAYCGTPAPATDNGGVWYAFTLYNTTDIDINLSGSDYDTKLFLYTGSCDGLVCADGDDDGGEGLDSRIQGLFQAGDYYIYVTGFGANRGMYVMNISCVDATCSPEVTAVASDSEGNPIEDCVDLNGEYYVFVTITSGEIELNDLYNVSINGGEPVQIAAAGSGVVGPVSAIDVANITVTGVTDNTCSGSASVAVDICPPSNDLPCDAIALPNDGTTGTYTNVDATIDEGEITPTEAECATSWCETTAHNTVWFSFVGPASGRAEVSLCGPTSTSNFFDSQVAIYSATDCNDYATFELLAANDDAGISNCPDYSNTSIAAACVEPGETYYVQVDGYFGDQSPFDITVSELDGAVCACDLPDFGEEVFTFADTAPVCEGGDALGFSLTFYSWDDMGSSTGFVYTYAWDGNDPIEIFMPEGGEPFTVSEVFPGGTLITITVDIDDPNCSGAEGSIYPLSGELTQYDINCNEKCLPFIGNPCFVDEEQTIPGIYNGECECIPVPANDTCADAIELFCGAPVEVGTNVAASPNIGCDGDSRQTVWYSFTSEADATVFMTACNPETNFDTDISIYTGTCEDDLVCFSGWGGGGYIDGNSGCVFQAWASEGEFQAEANVTYFIAVSGFYEVGDEDSWEGDFGLSLTCYGASVSLDGTVDWNESCGNREISLDLYTPDTEDLIGSYSGMVDQNGDFTISELPIGTFDVIAKVDGALAVGFADYVISSDENDLDLGAVQWGDINGDNGINIIDFSLINSSFNSVVGDTNFIPLADLNCSGGVNILDVSIQSPNFLATGATAPLE